MHSLLHHEGMIKCNKCNTIFINCMYRRVTAFSYVHRLLLNIGVFKYNNKQYKIIDNQEVLIRSAALQI